MPLYRFANFELDPARRELRRDGVPVDLPPKAFDVIVYLVQHRDRAVGRDELIAGVWGRVDVSDNVLDQIVLRARRALDDRGEARRCIATRPRFGFAWVAEVDAIETVVAPPRPVFAAPAPEPALEPEPEPDRVGDAAPASPPTPARPARLDDADLPARRTRRVAAFALAALALAAVALLPMWRSAPDTAPPPTLPTTGAADLLVLPFAVAPEANAGWARLGLMDLVAQRLRDAGADVAPSDNAVALVRGGAANGTDSDTAALTLAGDAGAAQTVRGDVAFIAGRWRVALRALAADAAPIAVQADADDPLDAARAAADRLALALDLHPAGLPDVPGDADLALRLQRIDAAILGDALDQARSELAAMTPAQRALPDVGRREATLLFRTGDLDAAQRRFDALLADTSPQDDPQERGTLLNALGNLALRRGDAAQAERRADEAIALLAPLPPSSALGRAYTGRAIARSTQERFAPAMEDFARARVVLESVGDRLGVARIDVNIGILEARRDRHADAEPVLATAADRLAAFNDLTNELYARVTLAQARLALLDPGAALSGDARLADLVAREPNAERRRYANLTRADVLAANGRLREARALLDALRSDAGTDGDVVLLGAAQALGAAWLATSDPAAAAREARTALNAPWDTESPRAYAWTWHTLVRALIAQGDATGAEAALDGFSAWAQRQRPDAVGTALALARAELAASGAQSGREADGDSRGSDGDSRVVDGITDAADAADTVRAAFDAALAAADATRLPVDQLRASDAYARWLAARGDSAQAAAVAGRATRWATRDFDAALLAARVQRDGGHVEAWHAALAQARRLAGERALPAEVVAEPVARGGR
ncbi:winged helix-turn-helix domain-containing protein [Chiayiivirga flava]|uniref:DNA-binding winged helix-turn-helix (WHTH) protein/tetratricopeptide (TPR) repeat protein n=1 Tax=Chiayiivirga flava TaxID=659595 RepID=A0A7W8D279_9GAMM|nr:transcriptional regulator [Chiayiivirga flava]MBB5206489.1 DNA-binding winged helix-turn-helix (wHTH) protein/tetratricopeptide (TPR) repeat protein [Chiayiivirga flava]